MTDLSDNEKEGCDDMSCYWHRGSTKERMMHQQHRTSAKLSINQRFSSTGLVMLIVTGLILGLVCFFKRSATAGHRTQESSQKGDNKGSDGFDAYYKVIVTKNLFRPLGWRKKKSGGPSYTLLGTVIVRDSGNSKALILDKNTKQTYYVAVGDKIGNATVEKIASKKVALHQPNGGLLELKLGPMQFLKGVPKEIPTYRRLASRQTTRSGEPSGPVSRTLQIGYDRLFDRRRRMQERLSRYRSQGRL